MSLTKKRWIILAATCLMALCVGTLYSWSVFSTPLADYLTGVTGTTYTPSTLSIAFTVCQLVGPIMMISGGYITDKVGPRWVIFTGGALFGAGMLLTSLIKSKAMLIVTYGLLGGLGNGCIYGTAIGNSVKFFPDKRGLVGGITTAAYGLGSVIMPPVGNALISRLGVMPAFRVIGIFFLIILCGGAFLISKCPADFIPDGWTPPTVTATYTGLDKDWKGMLSDPIFYVMILMLFCGALSGIMCISQASPIAQKMVGMSVGAAATAVSVLALFNSAGRVVAGHISDRIGRINTIALFYCAAVVGLLLLYFSGIGSVATFYIGVSVVGVCFGAITGVFPGFTADRFGGKNNTVNYGFMFIGFAVSGYFGPMIVNRVFAATGEYKNAFLFAIGFICFGLVLSFIYRAMSKARLDKQKAAK